MLKLPAFLRDPAAVPASRELDEGFTLTGFFLTRHVLEPRGIARARERAQFIAALSRALPSVA
jgi:DNA repair protein RecO (recombination protein O)